MLDLGLITDRDACSISTLIGGSVKLSSSDFNFVKIHSLKAPQLSNSYLEPNRALFYYQVNKEAARG